MLLLPFLERGADGERRAVARQYRQVCELLMKKGVKLTSRIVPGGEHNEASWEKQLPFAIPALLYDPEG